MYVHWVQLKVCRLTDMSLLKTLEQLFWKLKLCDPVTIKIRRRNVLGDLLQKMKIFFSDKEICPIKVEFVSFMSTESGVDSGGIGREMFSLLYDEVVGKLLQGPVKRHTFVHDLQRLDENDFYAYGQCVVLSLLHGYDAPHQFCHGVASFILGNYTKKLHLFN